MQLWNSANGALRATLREGQFFEEITQIAFHPSGELLAACGSINGSDRALLWNVSTSTPLANIYAPGRALALSPDGTILALVHHALSGGGVELWGVPLNP